MLADKYKVDGSSRCELSKFPTDSKKDGVDKAKLLAEFESNLGEMEELQNTFYADRKEGLIIVLQALDAAGKDSLIRHVMSGMNPQGVHVFCLKRPSEEELAHDYLWRVNKDLPKRGEIAVFNRSYYEDVITADVLDLKDTYHMADRVIGKSEKDFIGERIDQVNNYEKYLYQNSYRIVKIFLHVSKDVQRERFLERIDREDKNWKFESGDLATRKQFEDYMEVFENVINKTSDKHSPWYVIPADDKWYTRYLVSEIVINALRETKPDFPELPDEEKACLEQYKKELLEEKGTPDELIRKENAIEVSGDGRVDGDLYDDGIRNGSYHGDEEKDPGKSASDKKDRAEKKSRKEEKKKAKESVKKDSMDKKDKSKKKDKKDKKDKDRKEEKIETVGKDKNEEKKEKVGKDKKAKKDKKDKKVKKEQTEGLKEKKKKDKKAHKKEIEPEYEKITR